MILDLPRFVTAERPYWEELKTMLDRIEDDPYTRMTASDVARLRYLYGRAVAGFAKMTPYSETEAREYLEALLARAYANCHPNRAEGGRFRPLRWLLRTLPQTFRRRWLAFALSLGLTIAGVGFGAAAITFDPGAKAVLMPFSQLLESPADRVHREESAKTDRMAGEKSTFAAYLMTHNIQVTLFTFALGATWAIGSTVLLFYNGVTLGAVVADYVRSGYGLFVAGWLLPHGVIEIPAILIGGQAAFVLASALIGWNDGASARARLRLVRGDVLTLAGGASLMLVWAGIVESFLSQYHYPVLPYSLKIAFGAAEGCVLILYFWRSGRT